MKYLDEYRDPEQAKKLAGHISELITTDWNIMEICGGQTHAILEYGIDELIPEQINLIHGPGCPVCVTPVEIIDRALELAGRDEVIFCSFGDMLRVPGSESDLFTVRSRGGDVRVVYSPMDAVEIARDNPEREVVFFAIGFETTAPANAQAVLSAQKAGLENFSLLVSQVLVPPAMETILGSPDSQVDGFLAAGHVCTVMGFKEYEPLADEYEVPIVVTGFEPLDLLQGIHMCTRQLEARETRVENQYSRSVSREGTVPAQRTIEAVFEVTDRQWRGIGEIPASGLCLREEYAAFDAEKKFTLENSSTEEPVQCISGQILQGTKKPPDCEAFGEVCTPDNPLGAPMVSSEGACAAYYRYGDSNNQ